MPKLKIEDIKNYCEIKGSKFLSTNYIKTKDKYEFLCSKCKINIFTTTYDAFKKGKTICGDCSGFHSWNLESIKKYCLTVGSEFLSKDYNSCDDKYDFKCKKCGSVFTMTFSKFKNRNKHTCRICSNKELHSYESVKKYIETNSKCKLISREYINNITKLEIKCECGDIFWINFAKIKSENKLHCNKCGYKKLSDFKKNDTDKINNYLKTLDSYMVGEYKGIKNKIKVYCPICKTFHFKNLKYIYRTKNTYCKLCNNDLSSGERRVTDILNLFSIKFEPQKTFKECRNKKPLHMDFYLPDYNCVIEFNGRQHYEPVAFGGVSKDIAQNNYIENTKRDLIKKSFLRKNKISLIEIPYWEYENIKNIIYYKFIFKEDKNVK